MNRDTNPLTLPEQRATALSDVVLIGVTKAGSPVQVLPNFFGFRPAVSERLKLLKRRQFNSCAGNSEYGTIFEFGTTSATQSLALNHLNRVNHFMREVTGATIDLGTTTGLNTLVLHVWSRDNDRWNLLGVTENLLPKMTDSAFNTVVFNKPIHNVPAGAFVGWGAEGNCVTALAPVLDSKFNTVARTLATNLVVSGIWNSGTTLFNGKAVNILLRGSSPDVILLGDSIMTGYPNSSALHENFNYSKSDLDFTESKTPGALLASNGISVLNAGIRGQTSTEITARSSGLLLSNAVLCFVHMGTNDIAAAWPATPQNTIIDNVIALIEAASARGVFIVFDSILPRNDWVGASAGANTYRRAINSAIKGLCERKYAGQAYFLDLDPTFGTGTNNDTLKTAYAHSDGIHLNSTGTAALSAIYYALANSL